MSLYESLDVFVGAGLLAIAPAAGCDVPPGAALAGGEFSAFLRARGEAQPVGDILDRLAHQIWLSQDERGIPMHVAEEHARNLVTIIDSWRADAEQAPGLAGSGRRADPAEIAAAVMAEASARRPSVLEDLSENVALFLLQELFAQILADPRLVQELSPAVRDFLASRPLSAGAVASGAHPGTALAPTPRDEIAGSEAAHGLSGKALARFAAIAERQRTATSPDAWHVDGLVRWLQETRHHLLRPSNEPAEVRQLKAKAAEALADGDFEAAMRLLQEVRGWLRGERRRTEQRLSEELEVLRAQAQREALATADLAEISMARLDFRSAADLFHEAAHGLADSENAARLRFTLRRSDALSRAGEDAGDSETLREAVKSYARCAELAGSAGDSAALAAASHGLGTTLLAMADHEPSAALYEQAGLAFRTALRVLDREADPRSWALARMGLGNALASLSEIEAGSSVTLEQAAVAYKGALEVLSRESDPMRWAVTRLNMSTVLIRLGELKDQKANWLAAAAAIVPAIEVLEAEGAAAQADAARRSLEMLHRRWQALEPPTAAE